MTKTLIVIDMQNDFIDGALGTPEAQAIVPNVVKKIEEYKAIGAPVIFTRDTHGLNYLNTQEGQKLPVKHCIKGTIGWYLHPDIKEYECEIIDKETFGYIGWKNYLFENTEIEIVGLCTDICVVSNALILKATYPEIPIKVDANCCAGVTPESHEAALKTMEMCQIEIVR